MVTQSCGQMLGCRSSRASQWASGQVEEQGVGEGGQGGEVEQVE